MYRINSTDLLLSAHESVSISQLEEKRFVKLNFQANNTETLIFLFWADKVSQMTYCWEKSAPLSWHIYLALFFISRDPERPN